MMGSRVRSHHARHYKRKMQEIKVEKVKKGQDHQLHQIAESCDDYMLQRYEWTKKGSQEAFESRAPASATVSNVGKQAKSSIYTEVVRLAENSPVQWQTNKGENQRWDQEDHPREQDQPREQDHARFPDNYCLIQSTINQCVAYSLSFFTGVLL